MSSPSVTFVNVFDVDPAKQPELVALLDEAIEQVLRHRTGFLAARVLVAADGARVINEVTWTDRDAVTATQSDPDVAGYVHRASELAVGSPGVYSVHARFGA